MRSRPPKRNRVVTTQQEGVNSRQIIIAVAVGLGILILGILLFLSLRGPAAIDGLDRVVGLSRGHDENATYPEANQLPPIGGIHDPTWQNCGIYETVLDAKNVIHSLEHGAVWVTYSQELPEDDIAKLQEIVESENFFVLSPYPGLRSQVVLTDWGIQLEVDSVDDSRIGSFIDRYQQGPQTPELGATCQNGIGSPIGFGN
jgi:hypothetical protein